MGSIIHADLGVGLLGPLDTVGLGFEVSLTRQYPEKEPIWNEYVPFDGLRARRWPVRFFCGPYQLRLPRLRVS